MIPLSGFLARGEKVSVVAVKASKHVAPLASSF